MNSWYYSGTGLNNPVFLIPEKYRETIQNQFIKPKIGKFIEKYQLHNEVIPNAIIMHDIHFRVLSTESFFYKLIFKDIKKKDEQVTFTKKYFLSFDKGICPEVCDDGHVNFGCITIVNEPICYFIYISHEEYTHFIRNLYRDTP